MADQVTFRQVPAGQFVEQMRVSRMNVITFMPCGIKLDIETGEVTIPDGLALSDAARGFWESVQHVSGFRRPGFW